MPKVSIVIPFYNNGELIEEMVNSVSEQQYTDWELLLINDGASTDIIESMRLFAASDERIKIINRDRLPKGAQTCRNIGLVNAKGEYVCFFDSDDILLPYCLSNRVKFMDDNKDLDFAVFRAHTYDVSGKTPVQAFGVKRTSDDVKYFLNGVLPFAVWTNIYRRQSLLKCHASWDEKILSLQDSDFNIQNIIVNKLKYSYYEGKEPDYLWRINHNRNSITKKILSIDHQKSHLYFIKKMIRTVHANYGTFYDSDIALRVHEFCLIFSGNENFETIELLNEIIQKDGFNCENVNRHKIFKKLKDKFNNRYLVKILEFVVFPKHICNRYRIWGRYKKDIE